MLTGGMRVVSWPVTRLMYLMGWPCTSTRCQAHEGGADQRASPEEGFHQ